MSRRVTGVNGFTDEHLAAFKAYRIERVFIAYDRDEAGDGAAETLAKKLMGEGIECLRVQFPHGFDANAYAMKVQPADKSLGVALRGAQWMGAAQGRANAASAGAAKGSKPSVAIVVQDAVIATPATMNTESSASLSSFFSC